MLKRIRAFSYCNYEKCFCYCNRFEYQINYVCFKLKNSFEYVGVYHVDDFICFPFSNRRATWRRMRNILLENYLDKDKRRKSYDVSVVAERGGEFKFERKPINRNHGRLEMLIDSYKQFAFI